MVTKEEAETAIADGDTSVVTEETKADIQEENKAKANDNAVASTPAPENSGSKSNGSSNTGSSNTGSADKASNGNNNSGNSSSNSNSANKPAEPTKPAETEKTAHTHNWVAVTKTVHHDEVGHYETVTVQAAYDEPVYESGHVICGGCGKDFGVGNAAVEAWGDHADEDFYDNCENYHTEERQVGTKHHDAVTEQKWVVDQKAYDETITTGYKCSCGATK